MKRIILTGVLLAAAGSVGASEWDTACGFYPCALSGQWYTPQCNEAKKGMLKRISRFKKPVPGFWRCTGGAGNPEGFRVTYEDAVLTYERKKLTNKGGSYAEAIPDLSSEPQIIDGETCETVTGDQLKGVDGKPPRMCVADMRRIDLFTNAGQVADSMYKNHGDVYAYDRKDYWRDIDTDEVVEVPKVRTTIR